MARPPKGKPLTLRPIRLDDDVWAECKLLGQRYGTINEGLRVRLLNIPSRVFTPAKTPIKEHDPRSFKGPLLKPKERK